MERALSEAMINYQNEEEAKILSMASEMNEELLHTLLEKTKITNEDMAREYSPAEVRELCLRTKVKVNMTLFNCVYDAKKRFDKKKRLENRSENFINAMLAKAVDRKMVFPYDAKDIAECNHIRQCQLKKSNNCRLDRWFLNSESVSESELPLAQLPNLMPRNNSVEQASATPLNFPVSIASPSPAAPVLGDPQPDFLDSDTVGMETELENDGQNSIPKDDWYGVADGINSESITIDSENPALQSQPIGSQPVVSSSEGYVVFGTQVPYSSTQSYDSEMFLLPK